MADDEGGAVAGTNYLETLKKVPLFEGLSRRDLKHLADQVREKTFRPGADIVSEGDMSGRLFVLVEGRAKVLVGGRARLELGPGSMVGELSILDRGARSATVRADTTVRAVSLSSTSFMGLLEEQWSAARTVLEALARRLRSADKALTH